MALLTDMNEPLANAAGNALEVKSALKLLRNEPGEERLLEVVLSLGATLLAQTELAEDELSGRVKLEKSLENGRAAEIFGHMVHRLGGPGDFMDYSDRYLRNAIEVDALPSPVSGYLEEVDGQLLGQAVIELGGGRKRMDDILDLSVGLDQIVRIGEKVNEGDPLLRIHAATGSQVEAVKILLAQAFKFSKEPIKPPGLMIETMG
jgi:thymidine phosphorylase